MKRDECQCQRSKKFPVEYHTRKNCPEMSSLAQKVSSSRFGSVNGAKYSEGAKHFALEATNVCRCFSFTHKAPEFIAEINCSCRKKIHCLSWSDRRGVISPVSFDTFVERLFSPQDRQNHRKPNRTNQFRFVLQSPTDDENTASTFRTAIIFDLCTKLQQFLAAKKSGNANCGKKPSQFESFGLGALLQTV